MADSVGYSVSAAALCRVRGPDPQRRKLISSAFFSINSGQSSLSASATLILAAADQHQQQQYGAHHSAMPSSASNMANKKRSMNASPSSSPSPSSPSALNVYALTSGDIIAPFLLPTSSHSHPMLHAAASIDLLLEYNAPIVLGNGSNESTCSEWWRCSLQSLIDIPGVDAATSILTQNSNDWALGWSSPQPLPSLNPLQQDSNPNDSTTPTTATSHANGRRRSAGLLALLKVERRTSEAEAEIASNRRRPPNSLATASSLLLKPSPSSVAPPSSPRRPAASVAVSANSSSSSASSSSSQSLSNWPAHYPAVHPASFPSFPCHPFFDSSPLPRGTSVTVLSSPYGLLSVDIFQNTITKGVLSNFVSLDQREANNGSLVSKSHFAVSAAAAAASNERTSAASLLDVPPSLLLLDARCFAGSEGAPVLLTHSLSNPTPIIGVITLPVRLTARGSAVELNLAIPAFRIAAALRSKLGLHLFQPAPLPPSISSPTLSNTSANSSANGAAQGRGEGWRILQSARRTVEAATASASTSTSRWSLISIPTASISKNNSKHHDALSLSPLTTSSASSSSTSAPSSSSPSTFSSQHLLAPCSSVLAVERAEKSVLMARIGNSWASAIVLTADGYLLTNAHLLRPFIETPPTAAPSTVTSAPTFSSSSSSSTASSLTSQHTSTSSAAPVLYDEVIVLKPFLRLSVRIDPYHMQMHEEENHRGTSASASTGAESLPAGRWVDAKVIYVSSGPLDVALLKIHTPFPLYPVVFHPTFKEMDLVEPSMNMNGNMTGNVNYQYSSGNTFADPRKNYPPPHSSHAQEFLFPFQRAPPLRCLPPVGSKALAIGHALFSPASALLPTVTAGVLSKIVSLPLNPASNGNNNTSASSFPASSSSSSPAMFPALLVSSAAVHNGNSGGLLVDAHTGYAIGMVTSNVMHTPVQPNQFQVDVQPSTTTTTDESVPLSNAQNQHPSSKLKEKFKPPEEFKPDEAAAMILPHLNFSLPYTLLLPFVHFCHRGALDIHFLRWMDEAPHSIQRLWQLVDLNPPPVKMPDFSPKYERLVEKLQEELKSIQREQQMTNGIPGQLQSSNLTATN